MSKALIVGLLFAGLPMAAYADENGVVGGVGAIVQRRSTRRPASWAA